MLDAAKDPSSGHVYLDGLGAEPTTGRRGDAPKPLIVRNPSILVFLTALALFTLTVTVLSEAVGPGLISTSFVKTLGKTLCLCLVAIAMDLVWGYCGILSLGHFAFFGLGGYMIGMWLMYERTRDIVTAALAEAPIAPTEAEIAPIASIYLAVWVAIGGRGRLCGAVIGAAFVSPASSWFTGGQAPDLPLGVFTVKWVDWWLVVLGLSFVLVTLFALKGIGGLVDLWAERRPPERHGADLGPDPGALREREAAE